MCVLCLSEVCSLSTHVVCTPLCVCVQETACKHVWMSVPFQGVCCWANDLHLCDKYTEGLTWQTEAPAVSSS